MKSTSQSRLRRMGSGFALEGPGYYLWDEDPREVLRAAAELEEGRDDDPPRPVVGLPPTASPGPTAES